MNGKILSSIRSAATPRLVSASRTLKARCLASSAFFTAAAIEQNHDERGIIWPDAIAPFTVVLCPISPDRFADVKAAADQLYVDLLAAGVDVILDDRNERPGIMFADWELIGVPHRITIGDRALKEGQLEYQHRRDSTATKVPVTEARGD